MKDGETSGEDASRRVPAPVGAADISIVVPTLNEADNVKPFIAAIKRVLEPFNWEIVFVDDNSPDGTWKVVQHEASHDGRIRGIRRVGRHGLASAAIEGFLSSASPVVVLMDGDLQHEEAILPQMISLIAGDHADLVVGSRYIEGGAATGLSQRRRSWLSFLGVKLGKFGLRTDITDPMSGFFAIKRSVVDVAAPNLSGQGFKILADILASTPGPMRIKEIPYVFRKRAAGESKLDSAVVLQFAELLLDKTIGRYVPTPFILFSIVGAVGVLVHLAVLYALLSVANFTFATAQLAAALCAMTFNFALNNITTYRTARLVGRQFFTGLLIFTAICAVGLLANVGIASFLFRSGERWWVAGLLGALVGSVWNYAVSRLFVWGRR